MASFVVTCTTDCLFAGTYNQVNDNLFTKGTYKIIRYKGLGIPESYAGVASNGKDKLTLKRVGATNQFTGTEKYTNGKLYRGGPDSYAERPVQAVYIPADVPPAPPVAVPSPAGLGVDGVLQPDTVTPKPDPAHAKVDNPEVPTEQKPSVPSDPQLTVPQTPPASSSSSDPPPPPPPPPASSSAPPPPASSSARGMPTSSIVAIVAIVAACIVGLIMTVFYFYDQKSTGYQRRTRHSQRRY